SCSCVDDLLSGVNHELIHPTGPLCLCVAIIAPVVHYTMCGLASDASMRVMSSLSLTYTPTDTHTPIPGLCAPEVISGVHGRNRLSGSSCRSWRRWCLGGGGGSGSGVRASSDRRKGIGTLRDDISLYQTRS
ncbi:hypothetical protein C8R45DRAFT_1182709, partial [Mycena sanguinolenta]